MLCQGMRFKYGHAPSFLLWFLESPVEARAAQCTNRILLWSISRVEEYVDNSESGRVDWF